MAMEVPSSRRTMRWPRWGAACSSFCFWAPVAGLGEALGAGAAPGVGAGAGATPPPPPGGTGCTGCTGGTAPATLPPSGAGVTRGGVPLAGAGDGLLTGELGDNSVGVVVGVVAVVVGVERGSMRSWTLAVRKSPVAAPEANEVPGWVTTTLQSEHWVMSAGTVTGARSVPQ